MQANVLVAVGLVVATLVAVPAMGLVGAVPVVQAQDAPDDEQTSDEANETAPGERLSGVLGAQQAEIDGEVRERSFGVGLDRAASNETAKADLVERHLQENEQRLDELEQRVERLHQQREDGEISEGRYRAEMAQIAAERGTSQRMLDHANATAGELPAEMRRERGIDEDRIGALRQRSHELGGPDVAEIARDIAGPHVGQGHGPAHTPGQPPGWAGPGERGGPGNETGGPGGPDGAGSNERGPGERGASGPSATDD